jgi:nucleotide-binding universal stress UspA family protein
MPRSRARSVSREILIAVDTARSVVRLVSAAAALAGDGPNRITGMFVSGFPIFAGSGDIAGWTPLVEAYLDAQRTEASAAEAAFRRELSSRRLAGDWIFREAEPGDNAIALAACHDFVVVGQRDPDTEPSGAIGLQPEALVLGAGRPVLIVPYADSFPQIGRNVLVAWNGSREAARALHDAMFVLQRADVVTVIEIGPPPPAVGTARVSASDVAAALGRRGVAATAEAETGGDIAVDDLLLSRAADRAADLLVMGGWGHSRLREYVLGGVSRGIFRHMTLPVLMSH